MVERQDVPPYMKRAEMKGADGPIDSKFQNIMGTLAHAIDQLVNKDKKPPENGFVLIVFPFGLMDGQKVNYVTNARREDLIILMRGQIARLEGMSGGEGNA
jgi:hypothetical protein